MDLKVGSEIWIDGTPYHGKVSSIEEGIASIEFHFELDGREGTSIRFVSVEKIEKEDGVLIIPDDGIPF